MCRSIQRAAASVETSCALLADSALHHRLATWQNYSTVSISSAKVPDHRLWPGLNPSPPTLFTSSPSAACYIFFQGKNQEDGARYLHMKGKDEAAPTGINPRQMGFWQPVGISFFLPLRHFPLLLFLRIAIKKNIFIPKKKKQLKLGQESERL